MKNIMRLFVSVFFLTVVMGLSMSFDPSKGGVLAQMTEEPAEEETSDDTSEDASEDLSGKTGGLEEDGVDRELFIDGADGELEIEELEEGEESVDIQEIMSVTAELGVQSVLNDEIPLIVTITPKIDSSKAQLSWDIPRGLTTEDVEEVWFEMVEGETRKAKIDVLPTEPGRYKIVIDVTAWRYDTNYVASTDLIFQIDENLHVTPAPDEYRRNVMVYQLAVVLSVIIAIIVAFFGIKFGIKRFKEWMAED